MTEPMDDDSDIISDESTADDKQTVHVIDCESLYDAGRVAVEYLSLEGQPASARKKARLVAEAYFDFVLELMEVDPAEEPDVDEDDDKAWR